MHGFLGSSRYFRDRNIRCTMESEFGKHREPRLKNLKSVDEKKKSKPSADRMPGSCHAHSP
jgi:hypothetical protein